MENCTNCFFAHNCPDCSKETCSACDDYVPTLWCFLDTLTDDQFGKLYGFGAPLRIGCFINTDTTIMKNTEEENNVG